MPDKRSLWGKLLKCLKNPPFFETSAESIFESLIKLVSVAHKTSRLDCMAVWVIDWQSRQAYKISVVMATCDRWSLVEGTTPSKTLPVWAYQGKTPCQSMVRRFVPVKRYAAKLAAWINTLLADVV